MFNLSKYCRICIKSDVTLLQIDCADLSLLEFGEKLGECVKMCNDRLDSSEICSECVRKIRLSNDFNDTCRKSNDLLRILSEVTADKATDNLTNFDNVRAVFTPLKFNRCFNKASGRRNTHSLYDGVGNNSAFAKNFSVDYDETPLGKLIQFSEDFFKNNSTTFQRTVSLILNSSNGVEDEEFDLENEENIELDPDIIKLNKELMDSKVALKKSLNVLEERNDNLNFNLTSSQNFGSHKKILKNSKCRIRSSPYTNSSLNLRSCPRNFETPKYSKSHCAKVHNALN